MCDFICCIDFASLDVVYELNELPGILVCSSCLISVCDPGCSLRKMNLMSVPGIFDWSVADLSDKCVYVYCVESFAHIECYSDCLRRGSHLVELLCCGVMYCV